MTYPLSDREAAITPTTIQLSASSSSTMEEAQSDKSIANNNKPIKGIFSEPGSLPLPDAGHHSLGVVWENVTVEGSGGSKKLTVQSFDMSALRVFYVWGFVKKIFQITTGPTRPLIQNFSGVVEEGEVLLVLGRPGSGCSTLMRALSNVTEPFVAVKGDIAYSDIPAHEAKKYYDGEIVFNAEDDENIPLLTVEETLKTAIRLKEPRKKANKEKRGEYVESIFSNLLHTFGMPHTRKTKVGDQFIRGVSGGERKRVSLSEILTTNAAVICWDNPIRGLDSAVALHFYRVLRELSKSLGMVNIISTYQTAQDAWECVDRVVVIYEGRQIYSGRASKAQAYFENMGWYKKPRQTTPDFLTAVTSENERRPREGYEHSVPTTPEQFECYFLESVEFKELQQDIQSYKERHSESSHSDEFRKAVKRMKHHGGGKKTPYRQNFASQVAILCKRQYQQTMNDKRSFAYRIGSNVLQATLVGAVCYKPKSNAQGSFAIAGALFFSILYYVIFGLGEIPATVNSRPLFKKHRALGFYHPAANTIAQIVCDIPIYILQTLLFSSIFYFLVGLNSGAKYFFTFWFIVFTLYETVSVMYRMIGSWSPNVSVAIRYGVLALSTVLCTAGFGLPPPEQLRWMSWLRRANPAAWAFEALMVNEFQTRTLHCDSTSLIPSGSGYDNTAYQTCSIRGASAGQVDVPGMQYVHEVYGYTQGTVWRDIGLMWAFFVAYVCLIIVGSNLLIRDTPESSQKVYKRGAETRTLSSREKTEEGKAALDMFKGPGSQAEKETPVYTFNDVRYTVQVDGKDKPLLNGISGYVKGGSLTALMGASGAGKTTLLDTISLRKTTGKIEGVMTIDGKPLDSTFSRSTGFAMQSDIHEPMSTVRECLQFSALLRQSNNRTRQERLDFAEGIIKLLELQDIADALIGVPGADGLGVEERKRVTIGVELAADPEFLLFLDEPTSGLDSQASYEIVRFLKRIAASGLAVLCTIHQPSGDLFEMFDSVVLLAPGGHTVYMGETGEHASTVVNYFASRGADCPPEANPAEVLLNTVAPVGGTTVDWPGLWKESPEAANVQAKISEYTSRHQHKSADLEKQSDAEPEEGHDAYASSFMVQTKELVVRNFRAQWRDGSFWTTQMVLTIFFGLFVGFYFFHIDHTPSNMSAASLCLLVTVQAMPGIVMDVGINYLAKLDMYLARERLGIYSWQALITSLLVVAMPVLLLGWNILFFCFYWTAGFVGTPGDGVLIWLCFVLCAFLTAGFGILLGAVSPERMSLPYILSLVWNLLNTLSWALVFYDALPAPFHYFFSWLSPLRYLYGALMTASLVHLPLTCTAKDLITFNPPSGQTCIDYAASYLSTTSGYLVNPDATSACQYCSSSTGSDYVKEMGFSEGTMWRDWALTIVWCISNVAFCFLFTWLIKIRPLYKKS